MTEEDKKLAGAIHQFNKQPIIEIEANLGDPDLRSLFLSNVKTIAEEKNKVSKTLLDILQENDRIENSPKVQQEDKDFLKIEKDVLDFIGPEESKRITATMIFLRERASEQYDEIYKQVIMKIHKGEISIKKNSVQFHYAHKEVYRQELQLPTTEDGEIVNGNYEGFDGKNIIRKEISQRVLSKNHKHYYLIQKSQKELEKEGKYIATEENNTFAPILNGFSGNNDQKIKAIQILTGFVGRGIISLEGDKHGCRSSLECNRYEYNSRIGTIQRQNTKGALLIAKDL